MVKGKFTQPSKSLIYYEHDCTLRGSRISGGSIWPSPMENSRTNELLGNRVKIKRLLHCQQELTIANLSFYRGKRMYIFPKTLFVIDPTWIKSFETFSPLFFHIFLMNLEVFSWNKLFSSMTVSWWLFLKLKTTCLFEISVKNFPKKHIFLQILLEVSSEDLN